MKRMVVAVLICVAIVGTGVFGVPGAASSDDSLRFRTLDVPDAAHTFLYDVNNRREAVGQGFDADFTLSTAALIGPRGVETYVVPGAIDTSFNSVSNAGVIAGSYTNPDQIGVLFTLERGERRSADFIPTPDTLAAFGGLNERGDLAGLYTTDFATVHAFMQLGHVVSSFDYPSPSVDITQAFQINDRREVVGWYHDGSGSHGYVRSRNGSFTRIDAPGAFLTRAFGINNRGEVVGYYQVAKGAPQIGFVWSAGRFRTVNYPGANGTAPQGINDRGDIVGYYLDADGIFHGFLATTSH